MTNTELTLDQLKEVNGGFFKILKARHLLLVAIKYLPMNVSLGWQEKYPLLAQTRWQT